MNSNARSQPLGSLFHDQLSYGLEKIHEGIITPPGRPHIGGTGLGMISTLLDKLDAHVSEVGGDGRYDQSVKPAVADARFAVKRIESLFAGQLPHADERDGRAYLTFLEKSVADLERLAAEIDA